MLMRGASRPRAQPMMRVARPTAPWQQGPFAGLTLGVYQQSGLNFLLCAVQTQAHAALMAVRSLA